MAYFFTALIPVIAVVIIIIVAKQIASHTFKCKHCSNVFHIKWSKVLLTEHSDNEYLLVCPHCKVKGWYAAEPKQ